MHLVTIDTSGDTGPTSRTVHEGEPVGPILTSKEGHHLGTPAWAKTTQGGQTPWNILTDPVAEPMTIKAQWAADQYTVRFANPGSPATPPADQTVAYGTSPTNP
ncbi:hypothetical protein [Bifidobacterium aemilianum]|uniref:hypothetical protein n=1 Tax=Bifidobacterium aemilianum TaxID=2493120 RepID=UPI001F2B31F5|nr:hypothetical protein [Bifidobacterium aemilianum]